MAGWLVVAGRREKERQDWKLRRETGERKERGLAAPPAKSFLHHPPHSLPLSLSSSEKMVAATKAERERGWQRKSHSASLRNKYIAIASLFGWLVVEFDVGD